MKLCTSRRSPSGRERRGADQTLPAGTAEHPAGVRQQIDEPQHQSAGLPPSAPAEGRTGGLQPGAAGASGQPGAAAGRLQEHAEIWSQNRFTHPPYILIKLSFIDSVTLSTFKQSSCVLTSYFFLNL